MAKISDLPVTQALTGAELLPIVQGKSTKQATLASFRDLIVPFLQFWYKGDRGDSGPADAFRPDLAALRSAAILDGKSDFDGSTWYWIAGDYSATPADEIDTIVVASDHVPLTQGAWRRQRASGLVTKPRAKASPPMTQEERNNERISLYQAMTPTMRNLTNLGRFVDVGPAVKACLDAAFGGENEGVAVGGKTLEIGGGRYYTSVPLDCTYRADNKIDDDGDLRRANIIGEGANNTAIFYTGPAASPALRVAGYRGTTNNDGVLMRTRIEGLWLRRHPIGARTGIGLQGRYVVGLWLSDVIIEGFDLNADLRDIIQFRADELQLLTANVGLRAQLGDFTNPNVFQMRGGQVSGTRDIGLHLIRPANAILDTVRFENCGMDADKSSTILAELGTPEGCGSLTVFNCYFENCQGNADLQLAHGYPYNAMVKWYMNTCHRGGGRFVKHHIDAAITGLAASANASLVIDHGPQEYRNVGTYESSRLRPAVRVQTKGIKLNEHPCNIYPSDNERPETYGFPIVGDKTEVINGTINADGTFDQDPAATTNIARVELLETPGLFRLHYLVPPRDATRINPLMTLNNVTGSVSWAFRAPGHIDVQTSALTGDGKALPFSISAMGHF